MEDMLFVSSSTLLLSDDEYEEILKKIGLILSDAIQEQAIEGAKSAQAHACVVTS